MSSNLLLLAQAGPNSGIGPLIFIAAMMAVVYFVMIVPQQRQAKQHRNMLSALKKGDQVVTQGGMLGKIHVVADKWVTLEIDNGVRVQVLKGSIQSLASTDSAPAKSEESKERSG